MLAWKSGNTSPMWRCALEADEGSCAPKEDGQAFVRLAQPPVGNNRRYPNSGQAVQRRPDGQGHVDTHREIAAVTFAKVYRRREITG